LTAINLVSGGLIALLIIMMVQASIREKQRRATWLCMAAFPVNLVFWGALIQLRHFPLVQTANAVFLGFLFLTVFVAWIPWFPRGLQVESPGPGAEAMDEREHMFSRNELQYHPRLAQAYYADHPARRETDRAVHAAVELGDPGGLYFDRRFATMASAAFEFLDRSRQCQPTEPPSTAKRPDSGPPDQLAADIQSLGGYYGAVDVGFAALEPYHWYSHAGRHAEGWGDAIHPSHDRGIVIVVAMDVRMIQHSPALPVLLESSRQYVESAKIANVVTHYLRALGHDARAHTDANYQLMCVPVAVSAGLGELGRMGIFMHRVHGPCVRLAVVSTNAPLPSGKPLNQHVADFCRICKKCAENCPSRAIPEGEEPESRGFRHWSILQERCFAFWKRIGTDCAFCIRVCPYSKPDTAIHRLVRWLIARNPWNQRAALFFDDLLYGRRPPIARKNPRDVLPEDLLG